MTPSVREGPPGPVQQLGLAPGERAVVVHVDDIGMCQAANRGALQALEGCATCGSIMVPCPAFPEIAQVARERPELDLGVHLTLNAEHPAHRWGPVRDDVPGLVAPDGGMWPTSRETVEHADPGEVDRELRAQVDRALEAGIDVTHLDSHMGTVFDLAFARIYLQLALDYRLPVFLPRVERETLAARGLGSRVEPYMEIIDAARAAALPVFDQFDSSSLHFEPGTGLAHNRRRVAGLGPGLAYLITHCAEGGPELRAITADWRQRDEERRIYSDGSMERVFEEEGIRRVGMRALRDAWRDKGGGAAPDSEPDGGRR